VLVALCAAQAAWSAEGEVSLGSGINYSAGDYGGSSSTRILSIPFTARYDREPWILKLTVPYLHISGSSAVVPGFGRIDRSNRRGSGSSESSAAGIGDSTISATYGAYYSAASRSGIDLTGKLKLATGDQNRGLGTGGNDVSFQVDGYKAIDRTTLFGGVGYTIFGSSPFVQLENVLYASLGASYRLEQGDSAGVVLDARQAGTPAPAPQRELTAFWSHPIDRAWKSQAYLLKGFANGSPDWGAGVSVAYAF
jgi:hypothetical protein